MENCVNATKGFDLQLKAANEAGAIARKIILKIGGFAMPIVVVDGVITICA